MSGTPNYTPTPMPTQPSAEDIHRKLMLQQTQPAENFGMALVVGLLAAVASSLIWMAITYFTNYQIGWMALGVGFVVGWGVRWAGKGTRPLFGVLGATLALLGCMLGNLLTACVSIADQQQITVGQVLGALNADLVVEIFKVTFHPMDLLFYGLAVWWGYKYSFAPTGSGNKVEVSPKSQG
ncbi:MAG: hypothetical protein HY851_08670 [candidate division Zixibacteria bacterium]|nr:hypothetical protein [candidate division Zixibacteria bacterium]